MKKKKKAHFWNEVTFQGNDLIIATVNYFNLKNVAWNMVKLQRSGRNTSVQTKSCVWNTADHNQAFKLIWREC